MSVHVLRCPQCGADLEILDEVETIRCRYCRTPCRVNWKRADPALERDAQEFVDALNGIDLDALEKGLDELSAALDSRQRNRWLLEAVSRLDSQERVDRLAAHVVEAGQARELLEGIDRGIQNLPSDNEDPHVAVVRKLMDRLASSIRTLEAKGNVRTDAEPFIDERLGSDELAVLQRNVASENASLGGELCAAHVEAGRANAEVHVAGENADLRALKVLRSTYRWRRVQAVVFFPIVLAVTAAIGVLLVHLNLAQWVNTVGWCLGLASPLVAVLYSVVMWQRGTVAGQDFNTSAFLFGLPEVAVKSKAQIRWEKDATNVQRQWDRHWGRESKRIERDWQRALSSPQGTAWGGCLILIVGVGLAVALCSDGREEAGNQQPNSAPSKNDAVTNAADSRDEAESGQGSDSLPPSSAPGTNEPSNSADG